jgi:YcxB-like protein
MTFHLTGSATYSFGDIWAAAIWGRSPSVRWAYPAGAILLTIYYVLSNRPEDWDDVLYSLMLPAILLVIGVIALMLGLMVVYWRMGRDHRTVSYDIDEERLLFGHGPGGSTVLPWQQLRSCHEHRGGFVLFLKPMGAVWLIKRAFSAADNDAFRKLALARLGKAAHMWRAP